MKMDRNAKMAKIITIRKRQKMARILTLQIFGKFKFEQVTILLSEIAIKEEPSCAYTLSLRVTSVDRAHSCWN